MAWRPCSGRNKWGCAWFCRPDNLNGPDTMTLLIERDLAAFTHHQYTAKVRRADRRCGASTLADLLVLICWRAVPENRTEREQRPRAIEHHASVDLGDAFEHSLRELVCTRLSEEIIEF